MQEHVELRNRVVVVTGASSGFGKGAALAFARAGARVVLAARRTELLEQSVADLEREGTSALAVATDVSRRTDVEALARRAVAAYGRIDVWVNDAGVGVLGAFQEVPIEDHVKVIETNLLGTLYGTYYAYQQFLRQGAGIVINIASELGVHSVPYYTSYTAAKHGVVGLDETLQQEIELNGHEHIHVCTVLPTAHDTPFFDHVGNYTGHAVEPPKPLHDPQEVVDAILALARDPEDVSIVGRDGVLKVMLHKLAPDVAKKMAARQMHKTQMELPPPAVDTPGAVHAPMGDGTEISAGRKAASES